MKIREIKIRMRSRRSHTFSVPKENDDARNNNEDEKYSIRLTFSVQNEDDDEGDENEDESSGAGENPGHSRERHLRFARR